MPAPNLLNIDVDALFEQHNVSEIDAINKKIQAECELKREELRMLVGERYRDLLKAADTITEMKSNSSAVIDHVSNIIDSCKTIRDEQLIGFKSKQTDHQKRQSKAINNHFYGTVVQIKILTSLPEIIWTAIDSENYFIATQLFIFSRHISTGLKLDVNQDVMRKFPMGKIQWDLLAPFFFTIKQSCLQTLEREELTADTASKCLASLLLLENCELEKLLTTFINTRLKTFLNILSSEKYIMVKEKLLASFNVLLNTLQLLYECFIGSSGTDGCLMQELRQVTNENSKPTISLVNYDDNIIFQTLPDIIAKYKPQVCITELNQATLHNQTSSWLNQIQNVADNQLRHLIQMIASIKTIHSIRTLIDQIEKPKGWSVMCKKLYLPENLDFYKMFYENLINNRVKQIINSSWESMLSEIYVEVETLFADNNRVHRDMKSYVWSEEPGDNPSSLKEALSTQKNTHRLLMKAKGFPLSIVDVCSKIDSNLELLFNELKLYLNEQTGKSKVVPQEIQDIVLHLRECSRDNVASLITSIKSSNFSKSSENCVLLARLLQSISELCPTLRLCFSGNLLTSHSLMNDTSSTVNENAEKQWASIRGLLEEESLRFWRMWIELFVKDWMPLDGQMDLNIILRDFPNWENITIEEKDDQDNAVESHIQIPSQLTFTMQHYLHDIVTQLNRIIPHTLPRTIHSSIVDELIQALYVYYNALVQNEFVKQNQKGAWQFFFEVKILMALFVGRDQKQANDTMQSLVTQFKTMIDPFDFDVFYQHVNNNIKKNVMRMQHGLGCLIPNLEQLSGIAGQQAGVNSHDKDPNILTLSSTANTVAWFPLLPIMSIQSASEGTAMIAVVKSEVEKVQSSRVAKKIEPSSSGSALSSLTAKSGSFFGAMSQDWFRSN